MALIQWSCSGIYEIRYRSLWWEGGKTNSRWSNYSLSGNKNFWNVIEWVGCTSSFRVRQSAGQVGVDRVGLFIIIIFSAIPIMPS
jgi:hypothetical protein